jgi:HECT-like Ubiquitin-conjugating enzyme (E2)-binding
MNTISSAVVEHRPLIQCVNVFASFTADLPSVDNIGIQFNDGEFEVQIAEQTAIRLKFDRNFALKPQTLSSLSVDRRHLSFRVNTVPSKVPAVRPQHSISNFNLAVNLKTTEMYRILCSNCDVQLGRGQFSRILELPSDSLDMSEWFCCSHKHSDQPAFPGVEDTGKEKSNSNRFSPKSDEILFGNFYALFSRTLFEGAEASGSLVTCQGCGHVLGEEVRRTSALKIWNENLKFLTEPGDVHRLFDSTDFYANFVFIVQKCLAFEAQMGMPGPSHLLLEAKMMDGTFKFLFLQVMDKNLQIFRSVPVGGDVFELKSTSTVKVMFQVLDQGSALLKTWQNDSTVNELQISPTMMEAALDKLAQNSTKMPEIFRSFDGFTITYLNLQEH